MVYYRAEFTGKNAATLQLNTKIRSASGNPIEKTTLNTCMACTHAPTSSIEWMVCVKWEGKSELRLKCSLHTHSRTYSVCIPFIRHVWRAHSHNLRTNGNESIWMEIDIAVSFRSPQTGFTFTFYSLYRIKRVKSLLMWGCVYIAKTF